MTTFLVETDNELTRDEAHVYELKTARSGARRRFKEAKRNEEGGRYF